MFKPKVSALGTQIAELLNKEGVRLSILPGSELETLMSVSVDAAGNDATNLRDLSGINQHDVVFKKLVEMGSGAVRAVVYRTRQVVRPIIDEGVRQLEEAAAEAVDKDLVYTVEQDFLPTVFENPALEAVIEEFANGPVFNEKRLPNELVPNLDGELSEWIRIGVSSLDSDLAELIEEKKGELQTIFNILFRTNADQILSEMRWNHGPWAVVLGFALARGIFLRNDDLETDSDALYNYLRYVTALLGSDLNRIITAQGNLTTRGVLITGVRNGTVARVNPDVYKVYLDKGGKPEAVMGAIIAGELTLYKDIMEHEDRLLDAYRQQMRFNSNEILSKRREAMTAQLRRYMSEELSKDEAWQARAFEMAKKLDSEIALLALDPSDPYAAVAELVARVLFPNTPCLRILKGIDTYMRNNGTLTVNEAATLTQIDYVNDWLVGQVCVDPEGKTEQHYIAVSNMVGIGEAIIREVSTDSELASTMMKGGVELDITDMTASNLKNKLLAKA